MPTEPRKQCATCPWKAGADPFQIPNGYSPDLHAGLTDTIAPVDPDACEIVAAISGAPLRIMACHYSKPGKEIACVGWLANQMGPGNNIALRLAVMSGRVDGNVETDGEQHACFEDTLPACRR